MRSAIPTLLVLTFTIGALGPRVAHAQTSTLPGILDEEQIEVLEARVPPTVVSVRSREDLGPMARPRYLDGDGFAVWVRVDADTPPIWLTAHAWVANAVEIEVHVDGTWHPAERVYGTPFFDLSALDAPAPEGVEPLELADPDDLTLALFAAVKLAPEDDAVIAPTALQAVTAAGMEYYALSMSPAHNGTPIVDDQGRLVAISSFAAPRRLGGTLSIRAAQIVEWHEAWDRITDTPIGWSPRVETRDMPLSTGRDAIERR